MPKLPLDVVGTLPEYHELKARRRRIALPLSVVMLSAYYAFILLVAYAPQVLGRTLSDGVTSLGILVGLGVILLTFAVTVIYTWYANTRIEGLVETIQKKAAGHE